MADYNEIKDTVFNAWGNNDFNKLIVDNGFSSGKC